MILRRWRNEFAVFFDVGGGARIFMITVLAVAPLSMFGAAKNGSAMQLPGYAAVRVHCGPMNRMIMPVA